MLEPISDAAVERRIAYESLRPETKNPERLLRVWSVVGVERKRFELSTSAVRLQRSTN